MFAGVQWARQTATVHWSQPPTVRSRQDVLETLGAPVLARIPEARRSRALPVLNSVPMVTDEFQGMRITPNVYTTLDEIDLFADRVTQAIRTGIA